MKITSITMQKRDKNRVNVSVDGKYRFSLDIFQVGEIGLKTGKEYDENDLARFETESQFGKLYGRALEYCLIRPRSQREMHNYMYRKTRPIRTKTGDMKAGVSVEVTVKVLDRLVEKGYINDQKFAHYWVENRSQKKGVSQRRLIAELQQKGVDKLIIEQVVSKSDRTDSQEIQKIIAKKRSRYPDDQKLMIYLARLGFDYDEIKKALNKDVYDY